MGLSFIFRNMIKMKNTHALVLFLAVNNRYVKKKKDDLPIVELL